MSEKTDKPVRAARPRRTPTAPTIPLLPVTDDVAVRAYHIFLERGGEHGRDCDDWLQAERELALVAVNTAVAARRSPDRRRAADAK